ncbi:MAG: hypothetical protein ACM3PP_09380 [Candidatus Saccharibacteria bacterium]
MNVIVILVGNRAESAAKVQELLTKNGDMIRTRLGINRELTKDGDSGFIFLELCGNDERVKGLCDSLNALDNVKAECLKMELPGCSCQCGA